MLHISRLIYLKRNETGIVFMVWVKIRVIAKIAIEKRRTGQEVAYVVCALRALTSAYTIIIIQEPMNPRLV